MSRASPFSYRDRRVRERRQDKQDAVPAPERTLAEFADSRVVILLGEPGLGKTQTFEHAAKEDEGAVYRTVSRFLAGSIDRLHGKTLYLDALDEYRARQSDSRGVIDSLLGRLEELDWPKLRLSCRAIDWQSGDTAKLAEAACGQGQGQGRDIVVLDLLPLSDADILTMAGERLDDPRAFMDGAEERGLGGLLRNPELLDLLLTACASTGGWPVNRRELYEQAVAQLMRESNPEHDSDTGPSAPTLEAVGDRLMAVLLLANRDGLAMKGGNPDDIFVALDRLDGETAALRQAAGRRVFTQAEPGRVEPRHRTIAEFMAARHLRDRVCAAARPLPLSRVLALLTGSDGGTFPDTRGVFGWLATLLPGNDAVQLIERDPLGAILYGDTASWPSDTKRAAFAALRALADQDPWFRSHDQSSWDRSDDTPFGGLACRELIGDLRDVLHTDDRFHMVTSVLDIVRRGSPLPELWDDLLALARNANRDIHLRTRAVHAFFHTAKGQSEALVRLLDEVQGGLVTDESEELRACLLRRLYPKVVDAARIADYLVVEKPLDATSCQFFVEYELVSATPVEHLAALADGLVRRCLSFDAYQSEARSHLVGTLLNRIASDCPEVLTFERLYIWLGIGLGDVFDRQVIKPDDAPALFALLSREDVYCGLFDRWIDHTAGQKEPSTLMFFNRVAGVPPPSGFVAHVLWRLEEGRGDSESLISTLMELNVPLEALFAIAEQNAGLQMILNRYLWTPIPDWRIEQAIRRIKWRHEEAEKKRQIRAELFDRIDDIRSAQYPGFLDHPAYQWLAQHSPYNHSRDHFNDLEKNQGADISSAYIVGFRASLFKGDLPMPEEIAQTAVKMKRYNVAYPVLAGITLTAMDGWEQVLALPERTLAAAICFCLTDHPYEPDWFGRLLTERADLAGEALLAFWRAGFLADRAACPRGLDVSRRESTLTALGARSLDLLREFPDAEPRALCAMLFAALNSADRQTLLGLAETILVAPADISVKACVLWTAVAYRIASEKFAGLLEQALARLPEPDWSFEGVVVSLLVRGEGKVEPSFDGWQILVSWLTGLYEFVERETRSGIHEVTPDMEARRAIAGYINTLAANPSPETSAFLVRMRDDSARASWRDHFAHAAAQQAQRRRRAEYLPLGIEELACAIDGGAPAHAGDLQALVMDLLREIAKEMRDGAGNGWMACWNTNAYGHATDPKVEEVCRDVLLGHLLPRLRPYGAMARPEGHYAEEKRADIDIHHGKLVLPIEIKRQMHRDLWTAPVSQLDRQYSRSPESGGYGIYLAFWFGADQALVPPPDGMGKPASASELKAALERHLPADLGRRITVSVIDVAHPATAPKPRRGR